MAVSLALLAGAFTFVSGAAAPKGNSCCRYLPGDSGWPSQATWNQLNRTVGGRLITGEPLGRTCFKPTLNTAQCAAIKAEWTNINTL